MAAREATTPADDDPIVSGFREDGAIGSSR